MPLTTEQPQSILLHFETEQDYDGSEAIEIVGKLAVRRNTCSYDYMHEGELKTYPWLSELVKRLVELGVATEEGRRILGLIDRKSDG